MDQKHEILFPDTPGVAKRIVNLVDSSRTRVAQLSAVLKEKPLLTSLILKKANTIEYGLRNRIENLDLAIIILGFDVLKKTIASALIHDALKKIVDVLFKFDELWNHSISCGVIAHFIADKQGSCDPRDAFVAGLLHDVGHIIQRISDNDEMTQDHAILGSEAVKSWSLPSPIVEAIRWHHAPENALGNEELAQIVFLADAYCQTQSNDRFSGEAEDPNHLSAGKLEGLGADSIDTAKKVSPLTSYGYDLNRVLHVQQVVKTMKDSIVQALSNLPKNQKIVMGLHYYENLSFEEIAKLCGMETVRVCEEHDTAVAALKNMFVPVR